MAAANLITTFPMYARDEDCTHNRHWCRDKQSFSQPVPLTRLPPWIIAAPGSGTLAIWVKRFPRVAKVTTGDWINITSLITTATATVNSVDYLYYNWTSFNAVSAVNVAATRGGTPTDTKTWAQFTANCADLQLTVSKDSTVWYSELFHVKDNLPEDHSGVDPTDPTGCILLDFSDNVKVGDIPYADLTFSQRVFLPCDIGQPTYDILLDGPEDGNRNQTPSFRKVTKRWSTTTLLPEYMTDALAIMAIHSTKLLADQYDVTTPIHDVSVVPDWTFGPNLAQTTITFRRDFVRKYNC